MVKIFGKNKMPANSEPLCRTCTSALVLTGYDKSEQRIMCTYVHPNVVMPFTVNICSGYYNKNQPRKVIEGFKSALV
jgi:hypothetical protein